MKIVIVGAVAAGTSAAAEASRNDESAEIIVYEKGGAISYAGCGMPYYIGGLVKSPDKLAPRDPAFFKKKYNVDVLTQHEVLTIDAVHKTVTVKKLASGEIFTDWYDKLVLATGAKAVIPPIKGVDSPHVFSLRTLDDMKKIADFINQKKPQKAVVIGTGFIGLEVCENLAARGIGVTLIEKLPQVAPGLDSDMAAYVQEHIISHGVRVVTNNGVAAIAADHVILGDGEKIMADMVMVATGIKPDVALAQAANIVIGPTGAIKVNQKMQTSIPDIYACGDCIEEYQMVTGKPIYRPLGSTANKTGRIAGDCVTGKTLEFRGILGTGIFRVFDMTVAQTGLSEREAREQGYDIVVSRDAKPNKPPYMGGKKMVIKAIADKKDGKILGVQIVGEEGVDKRIDVFVTAISFGARVDDLFHLDLAYSPPFSTARDPVLYTGMILENAIR